MSVYIEYVIIDNMTINSLLLALVFWSLKEPVPKWRTLLSALLGTAFSILIPLFPISGVPLVAVKLVLSVAMVLIVKGKRKFIVYLLLFYLFTFLFGGACIGAFYLFTGQMIAGDTMNYILDVPVGLIVLGIAVCVFGMRKLFSVFYRRREVCNFMRDTELVLGRKSVKARGFLDSGNLLSLEGVPVVMVTSSVALGLLGIEGFHDLSCHNLKLKYIEINTMSGKKQLPVFRLDKLEVNGTAYDEVFCGISFEKFKMDCDVVLNCLTK